MRTHFEVADEAPLAIDVSFLAFRRTHTPGQEPSAATDRYGAPHAVGSLDPVSSQHLAHLGAFLFVGLAVPSAISRACPARSAELFSQVHAVVPGHCDDALGGYGVQLYRLKRLCPQRGIFDSQLSEDYVWG